MPDLMAFRRAVADWATRVNSEYFAFGSGRQSTLALEPIYADHADWFTAKRVLAWDEAWHASDAHGAHAVRRGLQWSATGYLDAAVQRVSTALAEAEAQLAVDWDGASLSVYAAQVALAKEPDPRRRRALHERCAAAHDTLEPLREERLHTRHAAAQAAGFPQYRAFHEHVLGIELKGLFTRLAVLLRDTERAYRQRLKGFLERQAGTRLSEAHRADAPFLMGYTAPGYAFPAERLVAALDRTLTNLGLPPMAELPITLDLEPRDGKDSRAFCCGIDIPRDVRLSHAPRGGIEDYVVTFHEMGHALHFTHTQHTLPPEDRYVGDRALTEAYAFLMEACVTHPLWLADVVGVTDAAPLVEHARLTRLFLIRRYVAKLGFELRLHELPAGADLDAMREEYARRLSEATLLRTDGRPALRDTDDGFYTADYLRAWCLDAQIRARLRQQFGPRWLEQPAAGALLRSWWAHGNAWSADELAAAAGVGVIRPEALIAELVGGD